MRFRILTAIAALALVIVGVVVFASPYAPVVTQAPENIEEIWDIEDTHQESDVPLVTALENCGVPLAYDAAANTFYCTLGLSHTDSWPEIHLTAPDASHVQLRFVDDYSYDWCADAVRDGYPYQVIAYTDTVFSYFDVVFTGLPQLCFDTRGAELTTEDSPVDVTMMAYGEAPLVTTARMHLRGASTLLFEKQGYKLEFTREKDGGSKKREAIVPGFGAANDVALLPCRHDETKMRDRLNWDMWAELTADNEPFGARRAEYVEVFKNGEYFGLYLMLEPVDVKEELALADGSRLNTDSLYRTAALNFSRDREYYKHPHRANAGYELYYAPAGADTFDKRFAGLLPYLELTMTQDDETFARRALELFDLDNLLTYSLLMQGGAIADNFFNNMYMWAHPAQDGGMQYRLAPWDLDMSWGFEKDEIGEEFERWLYFPVLDRMLSLDAGGIRQKAYDIWQQLRTSVFSLEYLEAKIEEYTFLLGESGALMRDAERWGSDMTYPDGYELITFAEMRWPLLDEAMDMILASDGPVDFLERSHYEQKAGAIHLEDDDGYAAYYEAVQAEMERYLQAAEDEYYEDEYYEDDGEYDE
ncbi:MAG: CotH kinase family protein [Clostridia bacterium]|nr:CotH kinase family protein [Clostridia bacterium]